MIYILIAIGWFILGCFDYVVINHFEYNEGVEILFLCCLFAPLFFIVDAIYLFFKILADILDCL